MADNKDYKIKVLKIINGSTIDAEIDLGFGVFIKRRINLIGVKAFSPRLNKSVTDQEERKRQKEIGVKARKRLKEMLDYAALTPEGLFIESCSSTLEFSPEITADVKYVYAKDLYNNKAGSKPWVGWQSVSKQLLNEELVELIDDHG